MISWPTTPEQIRICRELIIARCGGTPGDDAHYLVWMQDLQIEWIVVIDGWIGRTCLMGMASTHPRMVPRQLAKATWRYVFDILKRKRVLAFVDESNSTALRIDKWLGFKEERRWPGMGNDGSDLLLLGAGADDLRFYEREHHGQKEYA